MTELLYHFDSYVQEFDANVVSIDKGNNAICLDRTAFYPGGGGQPYDLGVISISNLTYPIHRVKKIGDLIYHYYQEGLPIPEIGAHAHGRIDWDRRYNLMRTHTAMHILCGVIFRDYGASVTGGDMEVLKGRMDFEFETMHRELVDRIETAVNQEVANAHDVRTAILPREEAFKIPDLIRTKINLLPAGIQFVRVVEIVGLDLQADGGTHVNNTAEIGQVKVLDYKSKGKINKRIYIEVV